MGLSNKEILDEITVSVDYIKSSRRYLHENAELSSKEYETSKFLKEEIRKLGLKIVEVGKTGFYAILDSKREGKTIALRADIDALPIDENEYNLANERFIKSKNKGVFHACGHDGHMAILLGAIKILSLNIDKLRGRIIFIFEEGEEIGSGIDAMIDILSKEDIDAFYGNHLLSSLDTGTISLNSGPVMAGCVNVDFTIRGKGGHGSRPDLSINPIFAATNIIQGLASAWVNRLDVTKTVTLGLGSINGGSISNVIPDEVNVTGTLRYFDIKESNKAISLVKKIGSLTAEAHECKFIINELKAVTNPVINDDKLSHQFIKSIRDINPDIIIDEHVWFASDSFADYSKIAPIVYAFVGIKNDKLGSGAEHHNEYFDIDEDSLIIAVTNMIKIVNDFLDN